MRLEAGDLVLVPFPFTDLSAVKTRPALVLSAGAYNQASKDIIVCGITSNLSNASHSVLLEAKDLASGRLVATSRAKVDKVVTLQQSVVRRKVGTLRKESLTQVLKEFAALFPRA